MPRTHLLVPKLALMEKRIAELDSIVIKLVRIYRVHFLLVLTKHMP
jgi:hypothetical protein